MKENQIEIIKNVRAIENEMSKRRGLDRLVNYNSGEVVHKKQMEFHKCDKKNRWVFGGNRTGKTECGAVETVWLLRGIHPYKKNKPDVTGGWCRCRTRCKEKSRNKRYFRIFRPTGFWTS